MTKLKINNEIIYSYPNDLRFYPTIIEPLFGKNIQCICEQKIYIKANRFSSQLHLEQPKLLLYN